MAYCTTSGANRGGVAVDSSSTTRPLRFKFVDSEIEAPASTTVFVPAGTSHTYTVIAPSRYRIFLTPRLHQRSAELRALRDDSQLFV